MKRILIFSIAYEPHVGGAELAVRNITDRLDEHKFDLITSKFKWSDKDFERIGSVNVHRVGVSVGRIGRWLYPFFAARLAKKLHKENKYDLVWAIMAAYAAGAALFFLNKYKRVPFLLTLQEGDAITYIHKKVRFFKSAWQEAFKRADLIQAISTFLADWARREGAVCPIEIVPNGVDLKKFNAENAKEDTKNAKRISRDSHEISRFSHYTIITTSRLVPKNGIDILIKSASNLKNSLRSTDYGLRFLILGSGKDRNKLERQALDQDVDDIVEFFGHVEPGELPGYLHEADIFVRPSRSEGLGSSFLEAMAAGLPVIAPPVGGIPDFLTDGETGLFMEPEDPDDLAQKIKRLIRDEPLRQRLAENGRDLVEREYNWDHIAQQMDTIFQKL